MDVNPVKEEFERAEKLVFSNPDKIKLPPPLQEDPTHIAETIQTRKVWVEKAARTYYQASKEKSEIENIAGWQLHPGLKRRVEQLSGIIDLIVSSANAESLHQHLCTAVLIERLQALREKVESASGKEKNEEGEINSFEEEFEQFLKESVRTGRFYEKRATEVKGEKGVFWKGNFFSPETTQPQDVFFNELLAVLKKTAKSLKDLRKKKEKEKIEELKEKEGFTEDLCGIIKGKKGYYRIYQPSVQAEGKIQEEGVILLEVTEQEIGGEIGGTKKTLIVALDGAGCFEWVAYPPVQTPFLTINQAIWGKVSQNIPNGKLRDYLTKLAGVLRHFLLPISQKKTE